MMTEPTAEPTATETKISPTRTISTQFSSEPPKKQDVSWEYAHELREENKGVRLKNLELKSQLEAALKSAEESTGKAKAEAEEAIKAAKAELKADKEAAEKRAEERIMRAELRTEAIKAGIVDLDGLKLADIAELKLNDKGEVEGAEALITKLKEAKPYLFKAPSPGSSNTNSKPDPANKTPKTAKDMTPEEREIWLKNHSRKHA